MSSSSREKEAAPSTTTSTINNTMAPSRTIKTFDGLNYSVWATRMKNILIERDIDKYLGKKETITNYNDREEHQALFEIQFALADNQLKQVIKCRTAYETLEKLKMIYQNVDKSNIMFLKLQFIGLKMKDTK